MFSKFHKTRATRLDTYENFLATLPEEERHERKRAILKDRLDVNRQICHLWLTAGIVEVCLIVFWRDSWLTFSIFALFWFLLAFKYGVIQVRIRQKMRDLDEKNDPNLEL